MMAVCAAAASSCRNRQHKAHSTRRRVAACNSEAVFASSGCLVVRCAHQIRVRNHIIATSPFSIASRPFACRQNCRSRLRSQRVSQRFTPPRAFSVSPGREGGDKFSQNKSCALRRCWQTARLLWQASLVNCVYRSRISLPLTLPVNLFASRRDQRPRAADTHGSRVRRPSVDQSHRRR